MAQPLQYEFIKTRLAAAGLKATPQRMVIYDALLAMQHHPTAEEIYAAIKPENPTISLGTVYKTLETLVTNQLIKKVMTDNARMRYDARPDSHSHIYCVNTQEILDFTDPELQQWMEDYFRLKNIKNLKIKEISVQINAEKINPYEQVVIN